MSRPSCFRSFDAEDEAGFWAVYQAAFDRVTETERAGSNTPRDPPRFGGPETPWPQVGAFYQYWDSFVSNLTFAWRDVWNPREVRRPHIPPGPAPDSSALRRRAAPSGAPWSAKTAKRARKQSVSLWNRFARWLILSAAAIRASTSGSRKWPRKRVRDGRWGLSPRSRGVGDARVWVTCNHLWLLFRDRGSPRGCSKT